MYQHIDDVILKGKTVLLRTDLNSSVAAGRVVMSQRIREHAKTIERLANEGAKVVVLSHQGRPGDEDCISLERHANKIRKLLQKDVGFIGWQSNYVAAIKKMQPGSILVLDNTRFLKEEMLEKSPEEHAKAPFVQTLAKVADYFVQDALSICHRNQASVVGFYKHMPCLVGPCLQKELTALKKLHLVNKGRLCILGGAKPEDSVKLLKSMIHHRVADEFLLGGLMGELFLKASGKSLGAKDAYFKKKGFDSLLPFAKELLKAHKDKLYLPLDLACDKDRKRCEMNVDQLPSQYMSYDIGKKTIHLFVSKIKASKLCILNGPMGVYEEPDFCIGTQKILEAMAFSKTFSILGGGETERALALLGLMREDFSHVSLAGKALLQYLSGNNLPGLSVLKQE